MRKRLICAALWLPLALVATRPAFPQALNPAKLLGGETGTAPPPSDPLGRDTPRGAVLGFLRTAESGNLQGSAEFMEIPASNQ